MEQTKLLVQSLEHACELKGYNPDDIKIDLSRFPEKHRDAIQAFAELCVIHEAQNEGHEFDFNDLNERKWFPWFDLEKDETANPEGFRFHASIYHCIYAHLAGGSRLSVRTSEEAKHVGETFGPLYKKIFLK
jgi:hypothetical protein